MGEKRGERKEALVSSVLIAVSIGLFSSQIGLSRILFVITMFTAFMTFVVGFYFLNKITAKPITVITIPIISKTWLYCKSAGLGAIADPNTNIKKPTISNINPKSRSFIINDIELFDFNPFNDSAQGCLIWKTRF